MIRARYVIYLMLVVMQESDYFGACRRMHAFVKWHRSVCPDDKSDACTSWITHNYLP